MATPNDPRFPDPALEVGVAQYPTPLVPDYYVKNGHIILVEKVSIEKGNYNPQPLDGSVTYTKRDANDWPAPLYLVFQRTEETGKFVFNYWANDRTLASQDPWNYGIEYSLNDPSCKVITRTYITPRDDYAPVELGSTDPVFGGSAIISKQGMTELSDDNPLRSRYVQVQRVYETIPSSVISGARITERGDLETIKSQIVVAGTAPDADGFYVTQSSIESVDAVKSKRTKGSVSSYSQLVTKAKRAGLLGTTIISDNIVVPSTIADDISLTTLESVVEPISATKSRKRTTTSSGPTSLGGASLQEFGIAKTTESIVAYNSSAAITEKTIKSDIQPIDLAKSKLIQVEYNSPQTLTGYQYDEFFEKNLTITRSIIPTSSQPLGYSQGLLSYKDEAIDPYKKQRTVVSVSGLPPTRTEYKTGTYTSPQLVFAIDVEEANFSAICGNYDDIRIKLTPNIRSSQSRQTIFKTITSYYYAPPQVDDAGLFAPVLREVAFTGYVINFNLGSALCNRITTLGPILVHRCVIAGCSFGDCNIPTYESWDIAETSITADEYLGLIGTYQKISWESRYWKAGIWQAKEIWVLLI